MIFFWIPGTYRSPKLTVLTQQRAKACLVPASSPPVSHEVCVSCQRSPLHRRCDCPRNEPASFCRLIAALRTAVQRQTTLLTIKGPIRERQIRIHPATATTPLAGGFPAIGQDHSGPIPAGFVDLVHPGDLSPLEGID